MTPLHAVPDPADESRTAAQSDPVLDLAPGAPEDGSADQIDLADDPRTDPEALLLCALMWSSATGSNLRVIGAVTPADFARSAHAELYAIITDLIDQQQMHDPASVAAALHRAGGGEKDAPLRRTLTDVVTADAPAESAVHYADIVLSQSYRRSFHVTGQRLIQAAEQGPEDELFDYMVQLGAAQRTAWRRLNTFRAEGAQA